MVSSRPIHHEERQAQIDWEAAQQENREGEEAQEAEPEQGEDDPAGDGSESPDKS